MHGINLRYCFSVQAAWEMDCSIQMVLHCKNSQYKKLQLAILVVISSSLQLAWSILADALTIQYYEALRHMPNGLVTVITVC